MTKPDFVGRVTSMAAPRRDLGDQQPYFVFSIPELTYPVPPPKAPVFYLDLTMPYADAVAKIVFGAYLTGLELQVGVKAVIPPDQPDARLVNWVQLPRAPRHSE